MFILASASPRREELLKQIGCEFQVIPSQAEEVKDGSLSPPKMALANAKLKARQVAASHRDIPVLGADTVVSLGGRIFGKPRDVEDAKYMLSELSGQIHRVVTGLALAKDGRLYAVAVTTEVRLAHLTAEEIEFYVATGEPMDKAGGYALQGRAAVFIEGINGSYSNVVGLPLCAFAKLAKKAGLSLCK